MGALGTARNIPLGLPFQGMDLQTPLAELPMSKAPFIENFFIDGQTMRVRNGSVHRTTIGTPAGNLAAMYTYVASNGSQFLFVADTVNNTITDDGLSIAAHTTTAMGNSAYFFQFGNYLYCIGNAYGGAAFDGLEWADFGTAFFSSGLTAGFTKTGTAGNFVAGNTYKNRVYLVEEFTTKVWYGGTNSVSGATTSFDIGTLLSKGGSLSNVYPVSIGGGGQSQSYLAFVTSEGEILYYAGSYPGSTNWEQVARVKTGRPKGRSTFTFYNGDVLLATDVGLVSLRDLLITYNSGQTYTPLSYSIDPLWRKLESLTGVTYGNMAYYEKTSCLYIVFNGLSRTNNVISATGNDTILLVYNILNGSWFYYRYPTTSCLTNNIAVIDDKLVMTYEVASPSSDGTMQIEKIGDYRDQNPTDTGVYTGVTITANLLSAALSAARDSGVRQKFNSLELFAYLNAGSATTPVECYLVENFGKVTGTTKPAIIEDDFNSLPLNVGSSREYVQYSLTVKTNSSSGDPTVLYNLNALMEQGGYR